MAFDPISGVLGLGGLLGGGLLGASAADKQKAAATAAANMPYVNVADVYKQSLNGAQGILPQASSIAKEVTKGDEASLMDELNQAIPGYSTGQAGRTANANALIAGQLPQGVADQVNRASNARALAGGYGFSPRAEGLSARDLGLTTLDLQNQGNQQFSNILSSTPRANLMSAGSLLINPNQVYSGDVTQHGEQLNALMQAAGAPTGGQVWGNALGSLGGTLLEGAFGSNGLGSLLGGGNSYNPPTSMADGTV